MSLERLLLTISSATKLIKFDAFTSLLKVGMHSERSDIKIQK